jgi:hypothetical protein
VQRKYEMHRTKQEGCPQRFLASAHIPAAARRHTAAPKLASIQRALTTIRRDGKLKSLLNAAEGGTRQEILFSYAASQAEGTRMPTTACQMP